MNIPSDFPLPTLASLEFIPYLDQQGKLPTQLAKQIGVYAIFDRDRSLQFIHYSRDIGVSLKQHLIRQPQQCYWVKAETIEKPNRTQLESIKQAWIEENGSLPPGNGAELSQWTEPIDTKTLMTEAEKQIYNITDDPGKSQLLKTILQRAEAQIMEVLNSRNLQEPIRFHPKLKEQGLLDLK